MYGEDVTAVYMVFEGKGYVLSIGRDVTRQKQLQQQLKESKNLYRRLSDGAGDGMVTLDRKGRIMYANPAMARLLGVSLRNAQKMAYTSFVPPDQLPRIRELLRRTLTGETLAPEVCDIVNHAGDKIPVEINLSSFCLGDEGVCAHAVVRDLRTRLEREKFLRQADKIDAMRYFVSGAVQELKNPILGVAKRADGLIQRFQNKNFEYIGFNDYQLMLTTLEAIRDQAQACVATVTDLLGRTQQKTGLGLNHCQIKDVVAQALEKKDTILKDHHIRLKQTFAHQGYEARIASIDLLHVVVNVLDNAIQAMPMGGAVTITTRLSDDRRAITLSIRDEGVGIAAEDLRHIFEPFYTTKIHTSRRSSGLGLSIAHSLVTSWQGEIHVTSSLRHGTTVTVRVPVYRRSPKARS